MKIKIHSDFKVGEYEGRKFFVSNAVKALLIKNKEIKGLVTLDMEYFPDGEVKGLLKLKSSNNWEEVEI